jgi:hypothetical protein
MTGLRLQVWAVVRGFDPANSPEKTLKVALRNFL